MNTLLTRWPGAQTWRRLPELLSTLGLLPLLAASDSLQKSILIAGMTLAVATISALIIATLRAQFTASTRWALLALLTGTLSLCGELVLQAWLYARYARLEFFIPWVIANSVMLTPLLLPACDNVSRPGLQKVAMETAGIAAALLLAGLMHDALGSTVNTAVVLIMIAALLALKNALLNRVKAPTAPQEAPVVTGSKRVRITGKL